MKHAFFLALLLAMPAVAIADPIQVTGTLSVSGGSGGPLTLRGERGLSITGFASAVGHSMSLTSACVPCVPGTTVSLNALIGGMGFTGTFEGRHIEGGSSGQFFSSEFAFMGTAGPVPSIPLSASEDTTATFSGPFTFSGYIKSPFFSPHRVDEMLTGSGVTTITVSTPGDGVWNSYRAVYQFNPVEPIPEPGSVLLVGGGIAILARRVPRARH